ncbi:MAG: BMP family lipoprotein, partial [Clostridium sp.]
MSDKKSRELKTILIGIISIILVFVIIKSQSMKKEEINITDVKKNIKIAIVFDGGGLGDKSFNDLTYDGILKAQEEFGIEFDYSEPRQVRDYEKALREYASAQMHDLIIAVGPEQEEAIKEISKDYPNQKFTLLDSQLQLPNVSSIYTRWQEQTFLNGVIAGMLIDYNKDDSNELAKAGVVVGKDVKHLIEGAIGFEAGVRYINKDIEVVVSPVGAFDNP